jgi:hypothetical protein
MSMDNNQMTYGDLYNMFKQRNSKLRPFICDWRPAGGYKIMVRFNNGMSMMVCYNVKTDKFELE